MRDLVSVKPLEWEKRDCWYAYCPILRQEYHIHFEEGRYWASWDVAIPGNDALEPLQKAADDFRGSRILSALTPSPLAGELVTVLQQTLGCDLDPKTIASVRAVLSKLKEHADE